MRPLSLRASVTVWFIGLAFILLGGLSLALYLELRGALRDGLDAALRARAEAFVGLCDWEEKNHTIEFELGPVAAIENDPSGVQAGLDIWSWPACELVHRSGARIEMPVAASALPSGVQAAATNELPATHFETLAGSPARRVCTLWARRAARPAEDDEPAKPAFDVVVRTCQSSAAVERQLANVRWLIIGAAGVAALVAAAFGFFLSQRFVRPLAELGNAAAAVRAGVRASMPRRGTRDEIDRLAQILDEAFTSLNDGLERQARFTSNAAHELRNPIAVIRNAADVALRHERSGDQYRQFMEDVLATSERMRCIVDALLVLARLDAGEAQRHFEPIDLVTIVRDSSNALGAGDESVHIVDGRPTLVLGDPGLLRVLVDNLVSNALRHAPGARVELGVEPLPAGGASLSVRDFGPGIPARARARVFERFYRVEDLHTATAGAGLGLSIVAHIARLHAAQCRVEDVEIGTLVTVSFPTRAERGPGT